METSEINKEGIKKCIFCFKSSNFNSESQNRISGIVQDIYISCMKYINSNYLTENEFRNWCRPNPLPFCKKCLKCSYKLNRMNLKLEQVQKQIEQLVSAFTTEFLKSRENPNICSEDDSEEEFPVANYLQTELQEGNANNESVRIKEEPNDHSDYFEDNESSPLSPFGTSNQDSNNDSYFSMQETKPAIKHEKKLHGRRKKKKGSRNKKSLPKRLNTSESFNRRRLQTDADGNPIPEKDLLPRRKAAMKAEETFVSLNDDLDNLSDKEQLEGNESDSEASASGNDFNPSVENAEVHDSNKPRKILKRVDTRRKPRRDANKRRPFGCGQCNKFYTTRSHLQEHILTHDESNRFKCTICEGVSFAYIRGLRQHMFKHKNNLLDGTTLKKMNKDADGNPIPEDDLMVRRKAAVKAEETFVSRTDCLEDQTIIEGGGGVSDPEASASGEEFNPSADGEEIHDSDESGKKKKRSGARKKSRKGADKYRPFKCVKCNKSYTSKSHLHDHLLTHNKGNRFKCTICEDVSFAFMQSLRQHMFKHKNNLLVGKMFKCKKCDTTFKTGNELKIHSREVHKDMMFECTVCGESYTFLKNLQQHSLEAHQLHLTYEGEKLTVTNEKPEIDILTFCNICNKHFKNADTLKSHQRKIHGPPKKRICHLCFKEFRTDIGLKEHLDRHNRDPNAKVETKFKCHMCEKFLSSRGSLNRHILRHSDGLKKTFECTLKCGKWFSTKSHLKHHLLYHKGERAFLCDECGKSFFTRSNLNDHIRIHTGLLHYCELCGKGFQNTTHLKQHHRSHKKDNDTAVPIEPPPPSKPESQEGLLINLLPTLQSDVSSANFLLKF